MQRLSVLIGLALGVIYAAFSMFALALNVSGPKQLIRNYKRPAFLALGLPKKVMPSFFELLDATGGVEIILFVARGGTRIARYDSSASGNLRSSSHLRTGRWTA